MPDPVFRNQERRAGVRVAEIRRSPDGATGRSLPSLPPLYPFLIRRFRFSPFSLLALVSVLGWRCFWVIAGGHTALDTFIKAFPHLPLTISQHPDSCREKRGCPRIATDSYLGARKGAMARIWPARRGLSHLPHFAFFSLKVPRIPSPAHRNRGRPTTPSETDGIRTTEDDGD